VAPRLWIEKDVARLLKKPPAPAELSGAIYEALTNVVGSEALASYRLGYYLAWVSRLFLAYDELRGDQE
jgi:hypothetical protein